MEAPERIWIAGDLEECGSYYPEAVEAEGGHGGYAVEYVRRDLAQAPDAGVVAELVEAIGAEARRYAAFYPPASDGQNTFVMFAEWVEQRALAIINKQEEPSA